MTGLSEEELCRIERACDDNDADELFSTVSTATVLALVAALREARMDRDSCARRISYEVDRALHFERQASLTIEEAMMRMEQRPLTVTVNDPSGLHAECIALRAEVEALRAAMPSDEEYAAAELAEPVRFRDVAPYAAWLARIESARGAR